MNDCVPYNSGPSQWLLHPLQSSCPQPSIYNHVNPGYISHQPIRMVQPRPRPVLLDRPLNYPHPMESQVRHCVANLEQSKNAPIMESRTKARAREEVPHNARGLEVQLKDAAHQLHEMKSMIARLQGFLEARNDLQDQTRDSNDQTRNSLDRTLDLLGEMRVEQDRSLTAQDETHSRITRIEGMVENMDMLLQKILKLPALQSYVLKTMGPGPSIEESPSERKASGRRSSTKIRKRRLAPDKIIPKGEQTAAGTCRRSSRLASGASKRPLRT
jgi:hypothetical protein